MWLTTDSREQKTPSNADPGITYTSPNVFLPVRRGAMVEKVKVRENREREWHVWARRRCNDRI
jgi:hypothetical protein